MFSSLKLPKNLRLRNKQQPLSQNQLEGGPPHLDLTSVANTKSAVNSATVVTTNRRSHKWSIDRALCPGFVDRNGNEQKMLTSSNQIDQSECTLINNLTNLANLTADKESHVYPADNWSQSNYGQEDVSVTTKLTHVCIERDTSGSLGITLRGGLQSNPENNSPLVITQVRPNGPADREGTIKVGDRLISVDGRPLHAVTLAEAQTILKDSGGPVSTLTIEYNVSNMDHLRSSHGTLLVEVNTTRPHSLGLTLVSTRHNSLVIGHVKVGSIAERCGAFMPGDQILAVNGARVEGSDMTASDVYNLLWHPRDSVLLIEVLTAPSFSLRGYGKNKWYTSTPTLSSPGSSAIRQGPIYVNHCKLPSHDMGIGGIVHSENMLVSLHANQDGSFGLMLQWSETQQSTVVACIESNGSAERCGCLRVGDRVLTVNECPPPICAEPRRLEQLLHGKSTAAAILSVQFDIAQSVVPATGIFTVKLANNKNCGLGITMIACNHGMVISQIRAGSVAHRSGTLFPGDRILAVNNCSMELLSLDEAVDLLQSAPDIVTLTIQKEVQAELSVVYTVELERNGGPLGITIAGSEDCCEPIVISALTTNGLAEKTGALHIGDRLLAIDGHSIEMQPLSQAIALLQQSGANVVLKVARSSQRMGPGYSSPGLPSVDSAVESWDSSQSPSTNQNCSSFYKQDEPLRDPPQPVWEKMDPSQQTCSSMEIQSDADDCSSFRLSESVISELDNTNNNHNNSNNKGGGTVLLPCPPCPLQVNYQHRNNTLPAHRRRSSTLGMQGSVEVMNIDHSQKVGLYLSNDNDVISSDKGLPEVSFDTFLSRGKSQQRISDVDSSIRGNDIFQVTLFKDPVYEDYGFSVSDGLYERGVFINRIRQGGPADNSRMLNPYDRILQVNDTRTHDFDCCLTVPLVAASGDRLTLIVSRPSSDNKDNSEGLPWVEEELEDSLDGSEIRSPTITKTL